MSKVQKRKKGCDMVQKFVYMAYDEMKTLEEITNDQNVSASKLMRNMVLFSLTNKEEFLKFFKNSEI